MLLDYSPRLKGVLPGTPNDAAKPDYAKCHCRIRACLVRERVGPGGAKSASPMVTAGCS